MTDHQQTARRFSSGRWRRLRSLRVRLIAVFAAVALLAAVSASGIAYWLNRDAVLKRAQDTALNDFRVSLSRNVSDLPLNASCPELAALASTVAVVDLMTVAKKQVSSSSSIEPYVVAIVLYLVLNGAAEQLCKLAERKMSYYR